MGFFDKIIHSVAPPPKKQNQNNSETGGLKKIMRKIPGFRTGKPWKMVVASFFYLMVLTAIFSPSEKKETEQTTNNIIESIIESAENTESTTVEETTEDNNTIDWASIDWNKIIEDIKAQLTNPESFSYVKNIDISVTDNENEQKISFAVAVDDQTAPEVVLDFADTIIRRFSATAGIYYHGIKSPTKYYYGGLYDRYDIAIGIAPYSKIDDPSQWFISDSVEKGLHTNSKLKLQQIEIATQAVEVTTEQQENTITVYITNTGEKYHSSGCRYLRKSKIPISLQNAISRGYSPCSKCNP